MQATPILYTETHFQNDTLPWLVFLHGFGGSTKMWNKQVAFFQDKFNLLLLDLPGHGNSPTGISDLGLEHFEDVADLVVEQIRTQGIQRAYFMCCSLSTLVFAAIQRKYPDMVSGAVLCGAVSGINRCLKVTLSFLDRIKWSFSYTFLLRLFAHLLLPLKEHTRSRSFFIKHGKLLGRTEFMAWFSLIVRDMDVLLNLNARMKHVLFISGTEDFVFLQGVKRTFGAVKGVRLKLLRHCGHVCNLQHPREFNLLSMEFLEHSILSRT